jgi:co-chaperonin GroES (HSP10)
VGMQAINYYLIIDKIKETPKKVGGLELTESQNKDVRYLKGEVISVGDQVPNIKPGDIVRYDKHAGHGIEYDDKLYYVIKISDVVIVE